jgi:DNA primase
MWDALPAGALRDQLLGDIAGRARLPREDLAQRWGVGVATRPERARPAVPKHRPRARAATRQPQDQIARILLQRCDWWHELTSEEHELLVALPGWHAEFFRWVDRWLSEHGPAAWPELRTAVEAEAWATSATALVDGAEVPVEPQLEDLRAALAQTQRALASHEAMQLLGRV